MQCSSTTILIIKVFVGKLDKNLQKYDSMSAGMITRATYHNKTLDVFETLN